MRLTQKQNVCSGLLRLLLALLLLFSFLPLCTPTSAQPTAAVALADDLGEDSEASSGSSSSTLTPVKLYLQATPVDANLSWTGSFTTTLDGSEYLRLCVGVAWSDGAIIWQNEDAWDDYPAVAGFIYTVVEGESIGVPSSTGLISGTGTNGKTKLQVELVSSSNESSGLTATLTITATHQTSDYDLSSVRLVDSSGTRLGSLVFSSSDLNTITTLYVKITYKNKSTGEKLVVGSYNNTLSDDDLAGLAWSEIDTDYASLLINGDGTASFKPIADGSLSVKVTKNHDGSSASDKVAISIATGTNVSGNYPSEAITFKIKYESDTSTVAKKVTWTVDEFKALGLVKYRYTLTADNGKFATDCAQGVTFDTILAELGIDGSDVSYFTFAANDGANPGKISYSWLCGTKRYWLPNYDIGGSTQGRKVVPSMLAVADCWLANEVVDADATLNTGTCFRLVYGSSTRSDSAWSKSLKWVNTVTIVLAGSPPSTSGDDDGDDMATTGGGSGSGGDGGVGGGDGSGQDGYGVGGSGDEAVAAESSSGSGDSAAGDGGTSAEEGTTAAVQELTASEKWRIYQMMNRSNSDVVATYEDNPLEPYVLPVLVLLCALAAVARVWRFKRNIRPQKRGV